MYSTTHRKSVREGKLGQGIMDEDVDTKNNGKGSQTTDCANSDPSTPFCFDA